MPEKNDRQPGLDVTAQQRQEILNILQQHLPADSRVWAYGSRVTGKAKRFSDLDLAIELPHHQSLSLSLQARLANAFDESTLPWKVDLLDLNSAPELFRREIDRQKVEVAR